MGKKYIIELEEVPFIQHFKNGAWETIYRVKGFNSLVFDWNGLNMLTPYTEPDLDAIRKEAYQQGYEQGYKDGYNEPGKGKIQVGDEVNATFGKAIVVNINSVAEKIWLVYADGHGGFEYFKDAPTKTGRHFPEIAEVFAKMKETDNG